MKSNEIEAVLPRSEIPIHKHLSNHTTRWHYTDNFSNYTPKGNIYAAKSFDYEFNSHGYRCPDFDRQNFNILSIGSSQVLGLSVPYEETTVYKLCSLVADYKKTAVSNWNLGKAGVTNDYVCRVLLESLNILKPNLILIHLTSIYKTEIISDIHSGDIRQAIDIRNIPKFSNYQYSLAKKAFNLETLISKLYINLLTIRNALIHHNWALTFPPDYFALIGEDEVRRMKKFLPTTLENLDTYKTDLGRDLLHPGPQSHTDYANYMFHELKYRQLI